MMLLLALISKFQGSGQPGPIHTTKITRTTKPLPLCSSCRRNVESMLGRKNPSLTPYDIHMLIKNLNPQRTYQGKRNRNTMKVIALVDKTNMKVQDSKKPSPKKGEVSIKVAYSVLNTAFHEVAYRTMIPGSLLHNLKVKPLVAGWHFSGTVESIAEDVSDLEVGEDDVFGHLQYASSTRQGILAEYITVSASECAKIPEGIPEMDVAAAITSEALTALQGMRDQGKLSKGKSILIIAVGGVGSQAVQVAKALKAGAVHAVCSTKDVTKAVKLGANLAIDR